MQTLTEKIWMLAPPMGVFDETVIGNIFPVHSQGARNALVHRAVASGEVIRLKPGLYCLERRWRRKTLHPFALASVLLSPSHISLESALWHHGLIPEAVREVASVTPKRSRAFNTGAGNFTFTRVPHDAVRAGVRAVEVSSDSWAFIATPVRAIADLVYLRRSVAYSNDRLGFLTDSLRIELDELAPLDSAMLDEVARSVRSKRVLAYLAGMKKELGDA